ncbi:hypothetical protein [Jiulongibacter sediminis]|uniref:hypothetical protein n=1 Tax=Jiulongibacter sediminis TaxID=1605367 RepID=UPI0026EE3069|nr:hypothetical protein [Jiulongibacter sediminis]
MYKVVRIIVLIVVLFFFLKRVYSNYSAKKRAKNNASDFNDIDYAREFAEDLYDLVLKKVVNNNKIALENFPISEGHTYGIFSVNLIKEIYPDTYLISALAKYSDLGEKGRKEVTKYCDLNLKLRFESESGQVIIYSDLSNQLDVKILKTDFAQEIVRRIKDTSIV